MVNPIPPNSPPPIEPVDGDDPPVINSPPPAPLLQTDTSQTATINDSISLGIKSGVTLPAGEISLLEFTTLVNKYIQAFKDAVRDKELNDYDISRKMHESIVEGSLDIVARKQQITEQVEDWNDRIDNANATISNGFNNLRTAFTEFNETMEGVWEDDVDALNDLNELYDYYNNLTPQQAANEYYNGNPAEALAAAQADNFQLVIDDLNLQLAPYNTYTASRPDVQGPMDTLFNEVEIFNGLIQQANSTLEDINTEREQLDIATPLSLLEETEAPVSEPLYLSLAQEPSFSSPLFPINSRDLLEVPNAAQNGTIDPILPDAPAPEIPAINVNDVLEEIWLPSAQSTLSSISAFLNIIELANEFIYTTSSASNAISLNLTTPNGLFQNVSPVFFSGSGAAGGVGLASAAMGLQTRNLEIILSTSIYRATAQNFSMPISGRLFARLQFTTMELLAKSSLLSANPAMRMLASRLGMLGASSPAIAAAIGLGTTGQVLDLINSGQPNAVVNALTTSLGFFARTVQTEALQGYEEAESGLLNAINTGNPAAIEGALQTLVTASLQLGETTRLMSAFGESSLGEMSATVNSTAAAINLSLLGVTMSQLSQAIDLPSLVPDLFAQISQLPPEDLLAAFNTGTRILDVLDNPISMVAIKQNLAETLIKEYGLNPEKAAIQANNALNGIILEANGINTFSQMQDLLRMQFEMAGFNPLIANTLANQTNAMLRGDIGALYLNAAYKINADSSSIASALAKHLNDASLATSLQGAIDSSLLGTYETQREFRDAVMNGLKANGFNDQDAVFLANSAALYGLNGSLISPNGSEAILNAVSSNFSSAVVDLALTRAREKGPFTSDDDFRIMLREEIHQATLEITGNTDGNVLFDQAVAAMNPTPQKSMNELVEQLRSHVYGLLSPHLGSRLSQEITESVLKTVLGGTSVDEIEENKNPVSVLNQTRDQIHELINEEDLAYMRDMIRRLTQLITSLTTPNAQVGYTVRTLGDNPGTFVNAVNSSIGSDNYQNLQIPM